MSENQSSRPEKKGNLHPRNRHSGRYEFDKLTKACPELSAFVAKNQYGDYSIDFADPAAVKTLNRALLKHFYRVSQWDIPENYLCPPIPGRADYLHHVADLLAACNEEVTPKGPGVRVLDVGVGSSCIYPILGFRDYGWHFLGSDVDLVALASAEKILEANQELRGAIELRQQKNAGSIFFGLLGSEEIFDLTVCNPPFHASLEDAEEGSRRKWRNLGKKPTGKKGVVKGSTPILNFGGQGGELWCPGGEVAFIHQMIEESSQMKDRFFCLSTLVSREASLPSIYRSLREFGVEDSNTIELSHGQKTSRIVAWTFLTRDQQEAWRLKRWQPSKTKE